jgi:hypothetical protein
VVVLNRRPPTERSERKVSQELVERFAEGARATKEKLPSQFNSSIGCQTARLEISYLLEKQTEKR